MKFGRFPLAECEGAILAHSVRAGKTLIPKGRALGKDDLRRLKEAGVADVMTAFLEKGDVDENVAASRIAAAIVGRGLEARPAATGRVNIHARRLSILEINEQAIDSLNSQIGEIGIATLALHSVVKPGQLVATIKVIPFAVPGKLIRDLERMAGPKEKPDKAISARPIEPHRAGLIQTELPGTPKKLLKKTERATSQRLEKLGSSLERNALVPHHEDDLAEVIVSFQEDGLSPILIMGASATLDGRDVVPEAIRRAGGEIVRFGMPVDPGNLLVLGRLHGTPIIGMPGCARSPAENGFDWVLEMVLAGLGPQTDDLSEFGVGGLLKETPGRPQPREGGPAPGRSDRPPKVAAIVLAAGQSKRMKGANKLLAPAPDKPLIACTLDALAATAIEQIVVVLGHDADAVKKAVNQAEASFVVNDKFEQGMGTSIAAGIRGLGDNIDAVLIVLGDMPRISPIVIAALLEALDPATGVTIAAPVFEGKRGNPVLLSREHFMALAGLTGDEGARELIVTAGDAVALVPVDDPGVLFDIDTKAALDALSQADRSKH